MAFLFHFLSSAEYYVGLTNFINIQYDLWRPILTVSIPLLVLLLGALSIAAILAGLRVIVLTLVVLFIFFHIWAVGMGYTLLGQAIYDVWGSYILRQLFGELKAVFIPIGPLLSVTTLIVQIATQYRILPSVQFEIWEMQN